MSQQVQRAERQSSLRRRNLALVLQTACASPSALSRADLSTRTGVTRTTASRLVDELVAGGLLDEVARGEPAGPGRPATPLLPGAGIAALGMQLDVHLVVARLVDLRGQVVAERSARPLSDGGPADLLRPLADLVSGLVAEAAGRRVRLVGAGLAVPGLVAEDGQSVLLAPNLGWAGVRPDAALLPVLPPGLRLALHNEADAAARALAQTAPGRPSSLRDFLFVSGGSGVGGAAVYAGEVVRGSRGRAGEVGHVCVDPDGPPCRCGSTGCLEQYVALPALLAALRLPPDADEETALARLEADLHAEGEVSARLVRALAVGLGSVLNVLDLSQVVLGGHLARLAPELVARVERELASRVAAARWSAPSVAQAPPQEAAGATGAALAALDGVLAAPAALLPPGRTGGPAAGQAG